MFFVAFVVFGVNEYEIEWKHKQWTDVSQPIDYAIGHCVHCFSSQTFTDKTSFPRTIWTDCVDQSLSPFRSNTISKLIGRLTRPSFN